MQVRYCRIPYYLQRVRKINTNNIDNRLDATITVYEQFQLAQHVSGDDFAHIQKQYGRNHRPKHVELTGIINNPLFLHLVGVYIIYINDAGQISNFFQTVFKKLLLGYNKQSTRKLRREFS